MPKSYYDLQQVREAILSGRAFLVHRPKNLSTLTDLGYVDADAFREILTLSPRQFRTIDWEKGRAADVYRKVIQGRPVYVKFFMENGLVVLSFHYEEYQ